MRVENGAPGSAAADLYTRPSSKNAQNITSASNAAAGAPDRSSLSSARELVTMAKDLVPSDRLSRFQALSAAVGSGSYEADPGAVGQALVNEHIDA